MKKGTLLLLFPLLFCHAIQAQENRFNVELDKFCNTAIKEFNSIPAERRLLLDETAKELAVKKYVVFTCNTNSRRTLMLQVWAQTAFYYYGLLGKHAFSLGNKVTDVYPGVVGVLTEAGFTCTYLKSAEPNGYVISINRDLPVNILSSKNEIGTIDTSRGLLVSICTDDEAQGVAPELALFHLPYESPNRFEQTPQERDRYRALNKQIAVEMLYLGERVKYLLLEKEQHGF